MSVQDLYTGAAGQAAVMSEFLIRGYNVAVPEVDRGDDLFVVQDGFQTYVRVQVKTARARVHKRSFSAQFTVPRTQLATPAAPELVDVFAVRKSERWAEFVVVERKRLYEEHRIHNVGYVQSSRRKAFVRLYLSFTDDDVVCSKRSFQTFRDGFSAWPSQVHT